MRLLDLFAGIGGFSLAAHWMGWQTVAFVEKEPFCQKVLRKNFGQEIEIHDDIFTFSGKPFRGRVDIVTGGFPCQPFSQAGKRNGRADERHLFPEMLRVIREVKPRWVVAENVRGLLSSESGSVFAEVVSSLESEGYEVITFCIPASAVEAPHRRDRLWIIANCRDIVVRERADIGGSMGSPSGKTFSRRQGGISNTSPCADIDTANPNNKRHLGRGEQGEDRGRAVQTGCGYDRPLGEPAISRGDDRDAIGDRLQGLRDERNSAGPARLHSRQNTGWAENWLEAATRFCRMDDGIPDRVHRLKALGNSIVPQIAFEIFRALEAAEKETDNSLS